MQYVSVSPKFSIVMKASIFFVCLSNFDSYANFSFFLTKFRYLQQFPFFAQVFILFFNSALSTTAGLIMPIILRSRFSNRRSLMAVMYMITGSGVLIMAFMANSASDLPIMVFGGLSYGPGMPTFLAKILIFYQNSDFRPFVCFSIFFDRNFHFSPRFIFDKISIFHHDLLLIKFQF